MKLKKFLSLEKTSVIILILLMTMVLGAELVSAQYGLPAPTPGTPTTVSGLVELVGAVVRWIYIIFFILAVAFILFAAFTYLQAGGDPNKVAEAKNRLIYAAVAIVIALLAVGFSQIIKNFLGAPTAGAL